MPGTAPDTGSIFHSPSFIHAVEYLRAKLPSPPGIALVLGSGLGEYAESLPGSTVIPTGDIPSYPRSTVPGHKGRIVYAEIGGKPLIAFQGRIHLYECNDLSMVLFPVSVAAALGARTLIVTNAAGGINRQFIPGDLMLITDQIDLTLHAGTLPGGRERKSQVMYDPVLTDHALRLATARGIPVRRGVYAAVKGPSYESAAEVEMIYRLGGDAVGMSTVKEVALASRLGMRILGISCITNKATGIGTSKLNHEEVTEAAEKVRVNFAQLLTDCISDTSM